MIVEPPLPSLPCPECKSGPLIFTSEERHHFTGTVTHFEGPDGRETPDYTEIDSYDLDTEEIKCHACHAVWPSADDFMACFTAVDHAEECVL